jgi:endonuclease YncB( thermonuclease family)
VKVALIVSLLVTSLALNAQTLQGKVVRVADGDTITILDATNTQNKVRLNKIDAPEKSQAFGEVSRKHLASMVAGNVVKVEWTKKDKYGRILGDITIGTTNVNLRMVQDGLAWHFKAFDNTKEFAQAEIEAREKKIGLWKDANPIPPWEFRKAKKEKGDSQ